MTSRKGVIAIGCTVAVAITVACDPPPPRHGGSAHGDITPAGLPTHLVPDGVALGPSCTPTGEELCFNAVDDNCNGVIDEGCGLCTGLLQFTIAWGDNPADVDLRVLDPNGMPAIDSARVTSNNTTTLRRDRECPNEKNCNGQNIENVCFEGDEPARGHYVVEVVLAHGGKGARPVPVDLGARVGSRTYAAHLELTADGDKKGFTFDL